MHALISLQSLFRYVVPIDCCNNGFYYCTPAVRVWINYFRHDYAAQLTVATICNGENLLNGEFTCGFRIKESTSVTPSSSTCLFVYHFAHLSRQNNELGASNKSSIVIGSCG